MCDLGQRIACSNGSYTQSFQLRLSSHLSGFNGAPTLWEDSRAVMYIGSYMTGVRDGVQCIGE